MKKVTRDFWTSKDNLGAIKSIKDHNGFKFGQFYLNGAGFNKSDVKITISWEEPEKTVTLTESQFDDIWNTTPYFAGEFKKDLKAKLFGGECE